MGTAFVAQRLGTEQVGLFAFNAARFAVGVLTLIPVLGWRRLRGLSHTELRSGLVRGRAVRTGTRSLPSGAGAVHSVLPAQRPHCPATRAREVARPPANGADRPLHWLPFHRPRIHRADRRPTTHLADARGHHPQPGIRLRRTLRLARLGRGPITTATHRMRPDASGNAPRTSPQGSN